MFKFSFSNPKDPTTSKSDSGVVGTQGATSQLLWFPAAEVFQLTNKVKAQQFLNQFRCGTYQFNLVEIGDIPCSLISEAEKLHSDLVPAIYEGGLKIWECTNDLTIYLLEQGIQLKGKRVLDLGCGVGVLGMLAIHLGAASVHFQDYNESVIKSVTIPNVTLNCGDYGDPAKIRFFAGDWGSFVELISKESSLRDIKYDCILTSETIYNPNNYKKLLDLFKQCLDPDGDIYLGAKTHYFGVGGGTRQFETMIAEDGVFSFSIPWKKSFGLKREILHIKFNK